MKVSEKIALAGFTTMKIGGPARYFAVAKSVEDIEAATDFAGKRALTIFPIGGGSNLIFNDAGYSGLILKIEIPGFSKISENKKTITIRVGAGEPWDSVVERAAGMHLSGIEALSLIPGTAGATPVQNVGAYGQEIKDTLKQLQAFDVKKQRLVTISNKACKFSYRNSIFKSKQAGRYIIVSLDLELKKGFMKPPFYSSLQKYLDNKNITDYEPRHIRNAVIAIRQSKLPDPALIANSGSFFQNPMVDKQTLKQLQKAHPQIPHFAVGKQYKLPAGWLLEKAGLKGFKKGHFATYNLQSLVITHDGKGSYQELESFKQEIANKVRQKFGIELKTEPQLINF